MKIILTNDDGASAPGMKALEDVVRGLGEPVVVAPAGEASGWSHQVTTRKALVVSRLDCNRFVVHGTPADCTRIALRELCRDASLVLAGINAGGNMGSDVFISGTVAAAREAVLLGVPAIAVSQYRRKDTPLDWERATRWARRVIDDLLEAHRSPSGPLLWNINLPSLPPGAPEPEVVFCNLDTSPHDVRFELHHEETAAAPEGSTAYIYSGRYDRRPRVPGLDVDVCQGGNIAVTVLPL